MSLFGDNSLYSISILLQYKLTILLLEFYYGFILVEALVLLSKRSLGFSQHKFKDKLFDALSFSVNVNIELNYKMFGNVNGFIVITCCMS